MTLNKFIQERRRALGISQAELAEKLGFETGQFVSNWERGVSNPPPETYLALARILKVTPGQLIALRVYDFEKTLKIRAGVKR